MQVSIPFIVCSYSIANSDIYKTTSSKSLEAKSILFVKINEQLRILSTSSQSNLKGRKMCVYGYSQKKLNKQIYQQKQALDINKNKLKH